MKGGVNPVENAKKRWGNASKKQETIDNKMSEAREELNIQKWGKLDTQFRNLMAELEKFNPIIQNLEQIKNEFPFLYYMLLTALMEATGCLCIQFFFIFFFFIYFPS